MMAEANGMNWDKVVENLESQVQFYTTNARCSGNDFGYMEQQRRAADFASILLSAFRAGRSND